MKKGYHASIDHWCLYTVDCAHYKTLQQHGYKLPITYQQLNN